MLNSRLYVLMKHVLGSSLTRKECPFQFMVALSHCGNVLYLTIANANEYKDEFEKEKHLQRALINTNNDVMSIVDFAQTLHTNIAFQISTRVTSSEIEAILDKVSHLHGIIVYWSGHGSKFGIFTSGQKFDSIFTYKQLASIKNPHKFYILDSCHSGSMLKFAFWNRDSSCLMICSCRESQESGAWIMDGSDSGGILTKCLTDPIGTWFKIVYKVFYSNFALIPIWNKYSRLMLQEVNLYKDLESLGIVQYFQNLLILNKFGDDLFHPQHPISFPDVSKTKESKYWNKWEKEVESTLEELLLTRSPPL